jgi:hypothetical protein
MQKYNELHPGENEKPETSRLARESAYSTNKQLLQRRSDALRNQQPGGRKNGPP